MLILSRKVGEEICIGDDVVVTLKKIKNGRVTIGVNAPDKIVIRRSELTDHEIRGLSHGHSRSNDGPGDKQNS